MKGVGFVRLRQATGGEEKFFPALDRWLARKDAAKCPVEQVGAGSNASLDAAQM